MVNDTSTAMTFSSGVTSDFPDGVEGGGVWRDFADGVERATSLMASRERRVYGVWIRMVRSMENDDFIGQHIFWGELKKEEAMEPLKRSVPREAHVLMGLFYGYSFEKKTGWKHSVACTG